MNGVAIRKPSLSTFLAITVLVMCFGSVASVACSTPVFRYALSYLSADLYEVHVRFSPTDLRASAAVNLLTEHTQDRRSSVNISVHLEKTQLNGGQQEQIAVYFPRRGSTETQQKSIWTSPLTKDTIVTLIDSPLRRELVGRLVGGDAAVWILITSGEKDRDDAAANLLNEQLESLQMSLSLPDFSGFGVSAASTAIDTEKDSPMHPSFSMLRLDRSNEEEAFFVASLLQSEEDLMGIAEPMAFAVFGRGRVLYALVGQGINPSNVRRACEFIIGPCSCQVKDTNPGVDLLLKAAWGDQGRTRLASDTVPLPSISVAASEIVGHQQGTEPCDFTGSPPPDSMIIPTALIVIGLVSAVAIAGTFVLRFKKTN